MAISGKLEGSDKRIEWSIPDFFILAEKELWLESPKFFFGNFDASWHLEIIPRWKVDDKFMFLYLNRDKAAEYEVECSFGLKKSDLSVVHLGNDILKRGELWNRRNFNLIEKRELLDKKFELVPSNTLTVICTVKFGTETTHSIQEPTLNETTPPMLSKLDQLSKSFRSIFNKKESCDVTLKVKNKEYKAHKIILIARSSVFATYFEHDTQEKQTGVITITDCDPDSFQAFLEYLYCGELQQISSSDALNLYYTSDKYDVGELKEFCVEYLMKNLTVENICEVAAFADKYDLTELYSAVQNFFNKNVAEISETPGWEYLMQNDYRLANKLLKESMKVIVKK